MSPPAFRFIDLFAGIGGFHHALAHPDFGGECVMACEIDADARKVYEAAHGIPTPGGIVEDIRTITKQPDGTDMPYDEIDRIVPDHDVLCGGFPCFPAGTLVETWEGMKPIEEVKVGELVRTHLNRWRPVTSLMAREADTVYDVKVMGTADITTTAEHPFYVRERRYEHVHNERSHDRYFGDPEWVEASQLGKQHFASQPADTLEEGADQPEFMYLLGRYLGDGCIVDHKRKGRKGSRVREVVISCNYPAAEGLAAAIERAGYHATRSDERTVVKFHISSKALVEQVYDFGRYSSGKRVAGWVLRAKRGDQEALLQGWLDSDGTTGKNAGNSTSLAVILGMAQAARNVTGSAVSIHKVTTPKAKEIEGRTVNQRPWYRLTVPDSNKTAFVEDGYAWVPVRKVTERRERTTVYNISVDEDESYTANGVIVHNCQSFSRAGKQMGVRDQTRGTLFFDIMEIVRAKRPKFVVLENVRNLAGPRHTDTWDTIVRSLRDVGYRVASDPLVFSPHLLPREMGGAPQLRDRVFILAERWDGDRTVPAAAVQRSLFDAGPSERLADDDFPPELVVPEPLVGYEPPAGWHPDDWVLEDWLLPDDAIPNVTDYRLRPDEVTWLRAWQAFVEGIESDDLPGFPIWSDDFVDEPVIDGEMPKWKQDFLRQNSAFYRANRAFIDEWRGREWDAAGTTLADFPKSRRKFEWQARKAQPQRSTRDLTRLMVQFRPSGIRVKPASYVPALVAITQTSVVGPSADGVKRPEWRRLTPQEAAPLQGMPSEPFAKAGIRDAAAYKQLGNAVNVGAVQCVARALFRSAGLSWGAGERDG